MFVDKQGYRFTGRSIGAESGAEEITLEQSDGPPAPAMRMLPPALTRDQEKKLLHVIFDPYAEQVLKQEQSPDRFRVVRILSQLDPVHTRERLERDAVAAQRIKPRLLLEELAEEVFKQSPDESLDMIAAIREPDSRAYAYRRVSLLVADSDRVKKLSLLNESLLAAPAWSSPPVVFSVWPRSAGYCWTWARLTKV